MEIGDIFVVNKADRENVEKTAAEIWAMLNMNTGNQKKWTPPVIKTTAIKDEGIADLVEKIDEHRNYLKTGILDARQKERVEAELVEAIKLRVAQSIIKELKKDGEFEKFVHMILEREVDPHSAADTIVTKKSKERNAP